MKSESAIRPDHVARLRAASKLLFGNADTLQVVLAVVESDGLVNATELSWELRIANNRVGAQLARLVELGLLVVDDSDQSRRKNYLRTDSDLWDAWAGFARERLGTEGVDGR